MNSIVKLRVLLLENIEPLGFPDPHCPDRFHLADEFWFQIRLMSYAPLGSSLDGQQAAALAEMLTTMEGWGWEFHLFMWKDVTGERLESFIKFLRGGGFYVVGLTNTKRQRTTPVSKNNTPKLS